MSQFITPDVADDAPPPRDLSDELEEIHEAQLKFAPKDYQLEKKYGKKYNQLDLIKAAQTQRGYTDEKGRYHPGTLQLDREKSSWAREGDVRDVEKLGKRTSNAFLNANPLLKSALTRLSARMTDSPLLNELNADARQRLANHGRLSAEEAGVVEQDTRSGFADRGIVHGNQALGAELLNRQGAVQARRQQEELFGLQVQDRNQAQNSFVAQGTSVTANALSDPFMAILGRASSGASAGVQGGGNAGRTFAQTDYTGYGQDLFNTNYNAGINLAIQQSNAEAATRAAIAEVAGSATKGAMMSDARLKDNVTEVGRSPRGHRIVEFNYSPTAVKRFGLPNNRLRGVIAQEVALKHPDAVHEESGYLQVDYDMIDVDLEEVN